MKVKNVRVAVRSAKAALDDFVQAGQAIERGEEVKPEREVYFESLAGFRKALTPKRLELLHLIRVKQPKSLQELSRMAGRNMKNIITDVSLLENLGLIEMHRAKKGRKESAPHVGYALINLEITV